MGKLLLGVVILIVALIGNSLYQIFRDGDIPLDLPAGYWGPLPQVEDTRINPFKINVPDKTLQHLKSRLKDELTTGRLTEPLENIGFEYGFNTKYLRKVMTHWHDKYDWRAREKLLNKWPQFKTKIAGIDIHFQHIKGNGGGKYKETKPMLILHGWPGSFVEHQKIIPILSQPENSDFNFELIIPSLPGFGFSDPAVRSGLGPIEMSRLFLELMKRLGHEKFYIQGGDWGSIILTQMAARYPNNVIAFHSNFCFSFHPRNFLRTLITSFFPSFFLTPAERERLPPLGKSLEFALRETGYFHIQATKPDTVGVALGQSPGGLAAYILEKFSTGTNEAGVRAPNGLLDEYDFTMDELLDNLMVYWVTNSMTTAMRIYSEGFGPREFGHDLDRVPVRVPTACMQTHDPYNSQSRWILGDRYPNMVRHTIAAKGGHFMSMEQPKLLADDVFQFIRELEK